MAMRLWNPKVLIPESGLEEGDEYKICEQFSRKIDCLERNKCYKPDASKDVFLSRKYQLEPLNLHEFCNRENCVESIQCERLRIQYYQLLSYINDQKSVVEDLVKKYHQEENPKIKLAIKGLMRLKSSNIILIEEAMNQLSTIWEQSQEGGDYLDKMMKFIRKSKSN